MAADLSDEMARRAHEFGDQVQDAASSAKNYASDQYERISSAAAGGSSQVDDGLRIVSSTADLASGATAAVRTAAGAVADTGMDAARTIKNKASDASDRAGPGRHLVATGERCRRPVETGCRHPVP